MDNNQEEELCNQFAFAAMPSPSRTSHQKKSAGEDGKSLGKCSDDNTTALHDMIASALIGLQKPWAVHLLLRCLPMTSPDIENSDLSGEPVDDISICDFLSGKKKEQHYARLNFPHRSILLQITHLKGPTRYGPQVEEVHRAIII